MRVLRGRKIFHHRNIRIFCFFSYRPRAGHERQRFISRDRQKSSLPGQTTKKITKTRTTHTHTRRRRDGRGGGGDYEKAGTTMMIRRQRTDGDCRAAVLVTAAAITEAATGAGGGRIIIIIVITTRAAVNTVIQHTFYRLPATVRKITKIAKPGRVAHAVQISSRRPKVIFPGAVGRRTVSEQSLPVFARG